MRSLVVIIVWALSLVPAHAQFNIDKMLTSGEVALHYEDYVLSIQYFNQIIALRPHMYQPWQLRAVAKFYLEDFAGAEEDATRAISLNPYIDNIYDLRAIARIRRDDYPGAIDDYTRAIALNPTQKNYWYNRAICQMHLEEYDKALAETDTLLRRWAQFANGYALKAELYLHKRDTTTALEWLDQALTIDPYDGNTWMTTAAINIARGEWNRADSCLTRALHLRPKHVPSYINRALARINTNNLRGAMSDYDTALDLDPNNFLAHYNRGLLLMQVGADNLAIEDFSYVIEIEPDNVLAIFNRGTLRENTGDLAGAIRDYSKVIAQFPNFWVGRAARARCYRQLGHTSDAEKDEFVIYKAQMDKHLGIQPRWSEDEVKAMRKRTEIDPDKYAAIVVDDETDNHDYESAYRGHVQNRSVSLDYRPLFLISLVPYNNGMQSYQAFDREVERFNSTANTYHRLYVTCGNQGLGTVVMTTAFALIDTLTYTLSQSLTSQQETEMLMQRAVAYTVVQNYNDAIADLDIVLSSDSTMTIALWQRAVCQTMINNYNIAQGIDARIKSARAMDDCTRLLQITPTNAYVFYDRAALHLYAGETAQAIEDYSQAIHLEPLFAEAYYNRGLLYYSQGDYNAAQRDLSKAGELGLYDAYSVLKRMK